VRFLQLPAKRSTFSISRTADGRNKVISVNQLTHLRHAPTRQQQSSRHSSNRSLQTSRLLPLSPSLLPCSSSSPTVSRRRPSGRRRPATTHRNTTTILACTVDYRQLRHDDVITMSPRSRTGLTNPTNRNRKSWVGGGVTGSRGAIRNVT